jgi:hypothetical protein
VIVGVIQEADPLDLVSGDLTELANRSEDIVRRSIVFDVQPIEAGYWGKDVFRGGVLCTLSAWGIGFAVLCGSG